MELKNPRSLTEKDMKGRSFLLQVAACPVVMCWVYSSSSGKVFWKKCEEGVIQRKGDCRYSHVRKPTKDF